MATTPALPRNIFNATLYNRLLNLWFANSPPTVTGPTPDTLKRWFGVGLPPDERASFDQECASIAQPALDFLAPGKYPLPARKDFEDEQAQATQVSEPFRKLIFEDGVAGKGDEEGNLTRSDVARSFALLLDQMPRNIFREQKEQWRVYDHYDRLSRSLTYSIVGLAKNRPATDDVYRLDIADKFNYNPSRLLWMYMPLEHSESLPDHDMFSKLMGELGERCKERGDESGLGMINASTSIEKTHRDILEKYGRYVHRNNALGRESTEEEKAFLEAGGATFGTS